MQELKAGDPAPEFTLPDETGNPVSLSDFRGKRVVLFYARDDTPGCTAQACGFRDEFAVIQEKNALVLGVSGQGAESHTKFKAKYSLPFPLLSDEDHSMSVAEVQSFDYANTGSSPSAVFAGLALPVMADLQLRGGLALAVLPCIPDDFMTAPRSRPG